MKELKASLSLVIFFAVLTAIYAPSCAILQQTPEAQAAGLDFAVLAELIPALINSDQLTTEERIELLETARTATTDPRIIARIDRELARQWKNLERETQPGKPDTPPTAPASDDEAFFRSVRWLRGDTTGPTARVTKRLDNLVLSGNRITFAPLDIPDWRTGSLGGDLVGVMCVAALRDGVWSGGKFEHIRNRMTSRDLVNVNNGYIHGLSLRRGEKIRLWILSYDGKQASNVVEVTY